MALTITAQLVSTLLSYCEPFRQVVAIPGEPGRHWNAETQNNQKVSFHTFKIKNTDFTQV